jgi:hypothetical protein
MSGRLLRAARNPREALERARRIASDQLLRFRSAPHSRSIADHALRPRTPWKGAVGRLRDLDPDRYSEAALDRMQALHGGKVVIWGQTAVERHHASDWHRDPTTGIRAARRWFTSVPYLDATAVGDHKGVWELNRLQWVLDLARAHALAPTEHSRAEIVQVLQSWVEENPPFVGINWASALEVAYRSITWTAILHVMQSTVLPLDTPHLRRCVDTLMAHRVYLEGHLSTSFSPNTHLTGEALALLVLGCAWPDQPGADAALHRGWQILETEAGRQVRVDGGYFEQSSWYLAYTVDIYAEAKEWGEVAGLALSPTALERLRRSVRLLRGMRRADGTLAPFGDDDGGSLWGDAFEKPIMMGQCEQRGAYAFDAVSAPESAGWSIDAFPVTGICRIQDESPVDGLSEVMLVDAGPHGAYGHGHDDALSFDLSFESGTVVADPGTGSYAVTWVRDWFRSHAAHATLGHPELVRPQVGGPFKWRSRIDSRLHAQALYPDIAWCLASVGTPQTLRHVRSVIRLRGIAWLIVDALDRTCDSEQLRQRFPLAAGCSAVPDHGASGIVLRKGDAPFATILIDAHLSRTISPGWHSTAYGTWSASQIIEASRPGAGSLAWCTAIVRQGSSLRVQRSESGEQWTVATDTDHGRITVERSSAGALERIGIEWRGVRVDATIERVAP